MSNSITIKKREEIAAEIRDDAAKTVELVGEDCEIKNFNRILGESIDDQQNVYNWIENKVTGKEKEPEVAKENLQNEDEREI